MSFFKRENNQSGVNFWPSYVDLMTGLFIVMLVLFVISFLFFKKNLIGLSPVVRENQKSVISSISISFNTTYVIVEDSLFQISIDPNPSHNIIVINEQHIQRIRFSANVLFPQDEYKLQTNGIAVLNKVGKTLKEHLFQIREIQIQGHADPDSTSKYPSNLHLASLRAVEVFNYLKNNVGIYPARFLMSATSFGEYRPTVRLEADTTFTWAKIKLANTIKTEKDKNRRIELLIFYKIP